MIVEVLQLQPYEKLLISEERTCLANNEFLLYQEPLLSELVCTHSGDALGHPHWTPENIRSFPHRYFGN